MSRGPRIDDETLQNIINKHTIEGIRKKKRGNLQEVKLAQIRCQNLFVSKINPL
jgi:FKBP-type peptidyl-prolyl cis-trans isomerase (trigger factor)